MSYIYKITNLINQKGYIGKTIATVQERFRQHLSDANKERNKNRPLYRAINKYGPENFVVETLESCSNEILNEREIYWIDFYQTYQNGYNATLGGDGLSYIDYKEVVETYRKYQNCRKTAEVLGIHQDSVSNILKAENEPILDSTTVVKQSLGKKVGMYSLEGEFILEFQTLRDGARYLIDHGYSNSSIGTSRTHISEVCRGKRKTTGGFTWKFH